MAELPVLFGPAAAREIVKASRRTLAEPYGSSAGPQQRGHGNHGYIVKVGEDGITGCTTDEDGKIHPGYGEATIYRLDRHDESEDEEPELVEVEDQERTVFNLGVAPLAAETLWPCRIYGGNLFVEMPLITYGKLDEGLLFEDEAVMSVWALVEDDEGVITRENTGKNVDVHDIMLAANKQLPSGTTVVAAQIGNHLVVISANECPEDQPEE